MSADILCIIPARGSSKRVGRKNIRELGGRPLVAYAVLTAKEAGLGEATFVSTEDKEIAETARRWGAGVIDRPAELAADNASTEAVLLHALAWAEATGLAPAWLMTLPPTSPLRRAATVRHFIAARSGAKADCLFSVTETWGDFWRRDADGRLARLFPDAPRRQQDRAPLYEENSAIYLTRATALRETGSILGRRQVAIAIDPVEGFDINTETDLLAAAALLGASPKRAPEAVA